ncbi:uncharacterized protein ATNIH1004_001950 [Aspergillus tanneri]|uniref:Kinesin light chain n=1 Tax=Aspergillus tanneri TaxID=1220188 RepID=A0A5M9M3C1_9EURO|nr:uncharacterized protein ATNIH1004_001950 [Aspergillus tanneri]KAA8641485.1 hypothetical protein ATNIH1004_001950 [Aspergillus tanneri]
MKAESLMGEILCHKGKYQEGESTISIRWKPAEDSPKAYGCLGRREEGVAAAEKRAARLQHLLGLRELHNLLGPRHPLTIWGLRILGASQMQASASITEPSGHAATRARQRRRYLGADHPETMNIVAHMGMMACNAGRHGQVFNIGWDEAIPVIQGTLSMLAMMYMTRQRYPQAQGYFDRLLASYDGSGTELPENVRTMAELCPDEYTVPGTAKRIKSPGIVEVVSKTNIGDDPCY